VDRYGPVTIFLLKDSHANALSTVVEALETEILMTEYYLKLSAALLFLECHSAVFRGRGNA